MPFLLFFFIPLAARATPNFPDAVALHLGSGCTPTCLLCHDNPDGGTLTAVQPFATAMQERGLVAWEEETVGDALDEMEVDRVDSDEDGKVDTDEVAAGANPNGGPGFCNQPVYGCVGMTVPGEPVLGVAIVSAFALYQRIRRRCGFGR